MNDLPHCIVSDEEIVFRYLQKTGPLLSKSINKNIPTNENIVSIIASRNHEIFREYDRFEQWPHSEGCLKINPLYAIKAENRSGKIELVLEFPKGIYEQENSEYKNYLPRKMIIERETLADMEKGLFTREINKLIENFVVLGMPQKYY